MRSGRWPKYGRHCALKMTKRRFTHSAVAHTTHIDAPAAMSGSDASCALPAKTISDIKSARPTPSPLLAIATPATRPQAAMPREMPTISRAPRLNSGWRQIGRLALGADGELIRGLSYGLG